MLRFEQLYSEVIQFQFILFRRDKFQFESMLTL